MLSGSENCALTPPAALDVDPPASWPRSSSATPTPASARWKAALVPMTPPPTTTTSARAGRGAVIRELCAHRSEPQGPQASLDTHGAHLSEVPRRDAQLRAQR